MNNKMPPTRKNNSAVHSEKQAAFKKDHCQYMENGYCDRSLELVLDMGHGFINAIKENAGDYKTISAEEKMSSVDKALGKRRVLAADIGLGVLGVGSALGLMWLAKKVLAA